MQVQSAARHEGEPVWQLPMFSLYNEKVKSKVADIKNIGEGRWGGAITAAKFLENFVGEVPWLHIDIAGPAFADSPKPHRDAGATGVMVRTLIRWIESQSPRQSRSKGGLVTAVICARPEFFPTARFGVALDSNVFFDLAQDFGRQISKGLRDRGFRRLVDQRYTVVADFDHRSIVVGQQCEYFAAERFLCFLQTDLTGIQTSAIDDDFDLALETVDLLKAHHQTYDVAQARQVELGQQNDSRGILDGRHVDGAVRLRKIDDQVRK